MSTNDLRAQSSKLFLETQERTCRTLEVLDGSARFRTDEWRRTDASGAEGGGGVTRVLCDGAVFEQAGVNFSEVHGSLPAEMAEKLHLRSEVTPFFATGISLVLHPRSPHIPTTHANFRYLEAGGQAWFGGGMDLTPYSLDEEDCVHFHRVLKSLCDPHGAQLYPEYKERCDRYFFLPHRGEGRGIGGIFFDYAGKDAPETLGANFSLVRDLAAGFLDAYVPIAARHRDDRWSEAERNFQLHRRGRYVEFNLIYDRGTLFGLKTGGRTESILMSLPPEVRWSYEEPAAGSREAALIEVLRHPRQWI